MITRFVLVSASLALTPMAACNQHAHTHGETGQAQSHTHAHGPHTHTHEDGQVHKARKPTAGLEFSYTHSSNSKLGQSGSMTLQVKHAYDDAQLELQMVGSNGVEINHGSLSRNFAMTKPGILEWDVGYRPTQEGTGYVSAIATVTLSNGTELGQAYSIPVRTGEVQSSSAEKNITEVIMEAEEEIIQ